MLCPQVLRGMAGSLKQTGFHPGHEYDIVVTSIDPTDAPADAAQAKQEFLQKLAVAPTDPAANSIHFLTGQQKSIDDLAAATGFHYIRVPGPDGVMNQFAHSSVIMIATPDGRMSKISQRHRLPAPRRPPGAHRGQQRTHRHRHRRRPPLLLQLHPSEGRYTVSVLRIMGLAAMGSVVALGGVIYLLGKKPAAQRVS